MPSSAPMQYSAPMQFSAPMQYSAPPMQHSAPPPPQLQQQAPSAPPKTVTTSTPARPTTVQTTVTTPVQQPSTGKQETTVTTTNNKSDRDNKSSESQSGDVVDYTKIPTELEKSCEMLDKDSALRPTIIKPSDSWKKKYQKSLLSAPDTMTLTTTEQDNERKKTFDLLDALTKSGALSVDHASLHVVIAATHCFDKTLMNTIVQDNVNPIEKVERSSLIVASTIQRVTPAQLLANDQVERVATYSPMLIESVNPPASAVVVSSTAVPVKK